MKNSRLKGKILITLLVILVLYSGVLLIAPNSWLVLLPIIIPAGILTVGIPGYIIIKTFKDTLENESDKYDLKETKKTNQLLNSKEKTITNKQTNNMQVNVFSEPEYEYMSETVQERNKVKTKGTII